MVLTTTKDYMDALTIEELGKWLDFKEGLLKDKKYLKVTSKDDMDIIKKECEILTNEISMRKFKEIFNQIGRCSYSENKKQKPRK